MALSYTLQFAGIPFLLDEARVIRMSQPYEAYEDKPNLPLALHQSETKIVEELNRIIPFHYLQDFTLPPTYPGRNLGALAQEIDPDPQPNPEVHINDWYYPYGASRWSVFRGLATADQAYQMLQATKGNSAPFVMSANPISPNNPSGNAANYTITTNMFLLPSRTLSELGAQYDGLYLVTLVDDRYYFQGTPVSLNPGSGVTWAELITQVASVLGISLTIPTIPAVYGLPEPDSQLWVNSENAAFLLDTLAYNIGAQVVRNYNGTYTLQTPLQSQNIVNTNRGPAEQVVRTAGGDLFNSGLQGNIQDFTATRNAIVPQSITVNFPKYVMGDDPVPHFWNPRYANQRQSAWFQESYGDTWTVQVPIQSGGPQVSGLTGTSQLTIRTTAKALFNTDADALSSNPINVSGLTALAIQVAQDRYNAQVASALDEVYPGTVSWVPEGIHDIIWTFSATYRQARTRIMRPEWNSAPTDFQYSTIPPSGNYTNIPRGVGGGVVAQTWRDAASGSITAVISGTTGSYTPGGFIVSGGLYSGLGLSVNYTDTSITFSRIDNFPTQYRWKGIISSGTASQEVVLFEGTSGNTTVNIVQRGIDGTIACQHTYGEVVQQILPDNNYGTNLITAGPGQFIFPGLQNSGGISETKLIPQIQTVQVLATSGIVINGINCYSGRVNQFVTINTGPNSYVQTDSIWIVERNAGTVTSGKYYEGQFVGFSASGTVSPVYLINEAVASSGGGGGWTGRVVKDYNTSAPTSGTNNNYQLPSTAAWEPTPTGPSTITGLSDTGGAQAQDGRIEIIRNNAPSAGAGSMQPLMTFTNADGNSQQANQVFTPGGNPYTMLPGQGALFQYSKNLGTSGGWQIFPWVGGFGGGGSPKTNNLSTQDSFSGNITSVLSGSVGVSDTSIVFSGVNYLPTQNRWVGLIDSEKILFEGTSGGVTLNVVTRGFAGTTAATHNQGATITWVTQDVVSGYNLTTFEKMNWVFPGSYTANTIEARIVPQTQTVICLASSGTSINHVDHWSGDVEVYDATQFSGFQFPSRENVWLVERNGQPLQSGIRYNGQFGGFSASGTVAPVYLVNNPPTQSGPVTGQWGGGNGITSGSVGRLDVGSGALTWWNLSSGIVHSGHINDGAVVSGSIASGQLFTYHASSGSLFPFGGGVASFYSGTRWTAITGEVISGIKAVCTSPSGFLQVAMAAVSGRNPAMGIVWDNVNSGIQANVFPIATYQTSDSTQLNFSGYWGQLLYLGRSGQIAPVSGSWTSGGFFSGDIIQVLGTAVSGGAGGVGGCAVFHVQTPFVSSSGNTTVIPQPYAIQINGGSSFQLTSGIITSGYIGDAAVVSGSFASGAISRFALASGAVNSGQVASGTIIGQWGGGWNIASGSIGFEDVGEFALIGANIAVGGIEDFNYASGSINDPTWPNSIASQGIVSGNYASGSIAAAHISSGTIVAGAGIQVTANATNITITNLSGAGGGGSTTYDRGFKIAVSGLISLSGNAVGSGSSSWYSSGIVYWTSGATGYHDSSGFFTTNSGSIIICPDTTGSGRYIGGIDLELAMNPGTVSAIGNVRSGWGVRMTIGGAGGIDVLPSAVASFWYPFGGTACSYIFNMTYEISMKSGTVVGPVLLNNADTNPIFGQNSNPCWWMRKVTNTA